MNQRMITNDEILQYLSDYLMEKIGMEASNQVAQLYRQLTKLGYEVRYPTPGRRGK